MFWSLIFAKRGYYRTWYELYFPRQSDFDELLVVDAVSELLNPIDQISTFPFFKKVCMKYVHRSAWELYRHDVLMLDDPTNYDSVLNGCLFDYSQVDTGQSIFVKIWDLQLMTLDLEVKKIKGHFFGGQCPLTIRYRHKWSSTHHWVSLDS